MRAERTARRKNSSFNLLFIVYMSTDTRKNPNTNKQIKIIVFILKGSINAFMNWPNTREAILAFLICIGACLQVSHASQNDCQ